MFNDCIIKAHSDISNNSHVHTYGTLCWYLPHISWGLLVTILSQVSHPSSLWSPRPRFVCMSVCRKYACTSCIQATMQCIWWLAAGVNCLSCPLPPAAITTKGKHKSPCHKLHSESHNGDWPAWTHWDLCRQNLSTWVCVYTQPIVPCQNTKSLQATGTRYNRAFCRLHTDKRISNVCQKTRRLQSS